MSVNTWNQTASKLDAFTEAVKLRHIVTQMILRDFGLKRDKFTALISKNTRDKYPELKPLIQRIDNYQNEVEKSRILKEYDDDFVKYIRHKLFDHTSALVEHIAAANEIQCKIPEEFKKRILLEDDVIGKLVKLGREVISDQHLLGFMMAPWASCDNEENTQTNLRGVDLFADALEGKIAPQKSAS